MKKLTVFFLSIFCFFLSIAQETPAPAQSEAIAIRGGTIHVGNGTALENGLLIFDKGKIVEVASLNNLPPINWNDYQVIDATGKHIYPGFIAPNTQIGLSEIGAVRATRDANEIGYLNPSIRSIIAYNTDSRVTPTVRSNGVLMAQVVPQGGRISGQSSIVQLDAWNWEDAAYKIDEGIHLSWPRMFTRTGWWTGNPVTKQNEKYAEQVREIEAFFKEAKAYSIQTSPSTTNLKFEAMRGLFDGSKKLYVSTYYIKTIMESVLVMKKLGINMVLVGGDDAWRIPEFLKENDIAVILDETQSLPARTDEDIDQTFKKATILSDNNVLFAFGMDGYWQQRNLPFQAGQAAGFGLDYEKAVEGLTLNTAKILGIDDTTGSLEDGKDATLIISEGDALDMRTCKVTHAFIQGRSISVDNKQKRLYRKFAQKYESEKE